MEPTTGLRVRTRNEAPARSDADYVLYWMIAARRCEWNFGLQRAVEWSRAVGRPLVVLEPLRVGYTWASDRLHRFVLDGMSDNRAACREAGVRYHPYVESSPGAGRGLLETLARRACVVVTDDYPAFFLPRMVATAAAKLPVKLEAVDSNGLLPLAVPSDTFATAYAFRRFLQRTLPDHLASAPDAAPLDAIETRRAPALSPDVLERWPAVDTSDPDGVIAGLPIDRAVPPVTYRGGSRAAGLRLAEFFSGSIDAYATERNRLERDLGSGLSPYLHFGHISTHQIFSALAARENWTPARLGADTRGKRSGWWGMSASAEAFLDQLVTWRELGFNRCHHREDHASYEALP
ncbi:MAG: deoxyribodipyrimidine photolyase, partial [Gemmatimonadetes bacterium]|nr:deoxyribodipyrimidine photolyase [Gemmatimonadota bacterium]